ncbi:MAG: transglycosylase domain-containing protein [Sarcina sp.]
MRKKRKQKHTVFKSIIKFLKSFILSSLMIFLTVMTAVVAIVGAICLENKEKIELTIANGFEKASSIEDSKFNDRYNTVVLDKNGKVIFEHKTAEYEYKEYEQINPEVVKAFISIEDKRFYEHNGIDFKALTRAGAKMLQGGDIQGGSTITQQVVKNVFLTQDQVIWRKLEEMVLARELEKIYSKDKIMEFYLNNIYFGYGCYGIESASKYYYQKSTMDLSLSQIAVLTGVTNNPTFYDPIQNPKNAIKRKNIVLNYMFDNSYITEAQLHEELEKGVELNVSEVTYDNTISDYAISFAIKEATEKFMEYNGFEFKYTFKDIEEEESYRSFYNKVYAENYEKLIFGGYEIQTCIDSQMQENMQTILNDHMAPYRQTAENGIYSKQASATLIDNSTGEVVGIIGGRGENGNTFNRASIGARQIGSTSKPILVYTPAFERGYYPESIVKDRAIPGGPSNWYKGYKGDVSLRYATEISINTIPWRLITEIGEENALEYLAQMQFSSLSTKDQYPPLALGGMSRGATTTEMASAYAAIANSGSFKEPTNVTKIKRQNADEIVYENKYKTTQVYNPEAANLMIDTLKGVMNKPHGTGKNAKMNNYKYQIGKTGTTDRNVDSWFIGATPYYTMAVWVGEDAPKPQNIGGGVPAQIWKETMESVHVGVEQKDFGQ